MTQPRRPKRILNVIPSRDTERDWRIGNADAAGLLGARRQVRTPKSVDLRADWWSIGDQGTTGSCVGWATADSVLRWHYVKAGKLKPAEKLSMRYVWMAAKESDEFNRTPSAFIETAGTSLKAALDVARKLGVVKDEVLPFRAGALYRGEAETFYATAARLKINSYFNLSFDRGGSLGRWRQWLANGGPILTRLDVDRTWFDAKSTKGNLDEYREETAEGGHAVAIVGYTADRFIVRNSWGMTGWGDKGFGYASLAYAQQAFTEAYGVDA